MYEVNGSVNWTVLSMQGDKKETLADPGVGIAGRNWNNIYMMMQSVQCHEGKMKEICIIILSVKSSTLLTLKVSEDNKGLSRLSWRSLLSKKSVR